MNSVNEIIEVLKSIWKDALESDEEIEKDVSFFELGGNSLLASVVIEEINKKFNTDFEIKDVYEHTTVAEQAEFIFSRLSDEG